MGGHGVECRTEVKMEGICYVVDSGASPNGRLCLCLLVLRISAALYTKGTKAISI